jgi:hypothetical protein
MKSNDKVIDYFSLGHPLTGLRSHFALKARKKMFELFMENMTPTQSSTVLDLGVTPDQKLPESNFFEEFYPYKDKVTAASIEEAAFLEEKYVGLKFVKTNPGEKLPFKDKEFDFLFCSAVIEHVGSREYQKEFLSECMRVSNSFFITTPNRKFPLDLHTFIPFIHWLPQSIHQSILRLLGLEFWAKTENLNLLTPNALVELFPKETNVKVYNYHLFGMPSNIVVYGNSIS